MAVTIAVESPLQDGVRALIAALNDHLLTITPPEYCSHMTVEQMAAADTTVFIARDEGRAVACGALRRHAGGVGEVKRMYTVPSYQGQGIGGRILARIERLARDERLTRLVLETGHAHDAAWRVYERGGFTRCGPVLDYPDTGYSVFYEKHLAGSLTTERLVLEPLTRGHAEEMSLVLADPDLYRYVGGSPPSLDELLLQYERQARGRSDDGAKRWFNWIARDGSGDAVGYVQATVDTQSGVADLAWVMGSRFQGHGCAREAATAMLGWLRGEGVTSFTAHIHPHNVASEAVARAIGLTRTATVVDGELRWESGSS